MKAYTLRELAEQIGADIVGDPEATIRHARSFPEAGPGDITLAAERKYLERIGESQASAIIVPEALTAPGRNLLIAKNPKLAFAHVLRLLYVPPYQAKGISPQAIIGKDTRIGADPSIAPYAVIGQECLLGDRVVIYPGVVIGDKVTIGDDTIIYANVTIYDGARIGRRVIIHSGTVVGSDGFGFVYDGHQHVKIPQVGGLEIQDDVEIGANCAIDRATLGTTVIGRGTKLDNFVHVGHNSVIGQDCILIAQVGLSGSTRLGNNVLMAGQAATNQHVTIGEGAVVTGQAGVTKNVKPGSMVSGTPAMDHRRWKNVQVLVARLPEIYERLKRLEAEAQELKRLLSETDKNHEPGTRSQQPE